MARGRTPTRPPLLSSGILRDNLTPGMRADAPDHPPEITGALRTLDWLAEAWSALAGVRSQRDPLVTREAAALNYKAAWERTATQATAQVRATATRLMERRAALARDARGRAGLLSADPQEVTEVRAVLRGMSQADRDAAITHAAETGDHVIMAAIQGHEILVGPTTLPIRVVTDTFVAQRAPDLVAQMSEIATAEEHLELAWQQFSRSVEDMRDRGAERAGAEGHSASQDAEARLAAALREPPEAA